MYVCGKIAQRHNPDKVVALVHDRQAPDLSSLVIVVGLAGLAALTRRYL